jgi:alkylation response protein AidB-like acyl-CoA dehydrogenase
MEEFFQDGPVLGNQYDEDRVLRAYLRRNLPKEMLDEVEPGLRTLGERAVTDILFFGNAAEANPPRHVPHDPWGRRIDRIEVCEAWKELERIAVEEGIVATAYERRHGPWSRVHQFARLHLYGPSSAIYTCPLAMTDGAARVIELYGDDWLQQNVLPRLISRDVREFWTSGQWMTERTGGSDVSGTSTIARLASRVASAPGVPSGAYQLYGTKWFTSATTAQMALTLARIDGTPANQGLSLFYVELRDAAGHMQKIRVHRLKDKLGTRALPTAELSLEGTLARLVGNEGHGVRKIAALLNVTRSYNACCAVSSMRRGLALARDYARRRRAFGKPLADHSLHNETLAGLQVEYEAAFHLTFRTAELMGKEETGVATAPERAVLRMLTPIIKLYTARQAITSASEVLEAFGGAGYIEDTGLPRLLRDAQVLSIWEGTTNVLSLDILRAIDKDNAFKPFVSDLRSRLEGIRAVALQVCVERVRAAVSQIESFMQRGRAEEADFVESGARALAYSLARSYAAGLLLEQADWATKHSDGRRAVAVAERWCRQDLTPLLVPDQSHRVATRLLAMDEG